MLQLYISLSIIVSRDNVFEVEFITPGVIATNKAGDFPNSEKMLSKISRSMTLTNLKHSHELQSLAWQPPHLKLNHHPPTPLI